MRLSLNTKISAFVLAMICLVSLASIFASQRAFDEMSDTTERMTSTAVEIIGDKDAQIAALLEKNLMLGKQKLAAENEREESRGELIIERKASRLDGQNAGIASTVTILLEEEMMSGEGSAAEHLFDTLADSAGIESIKLWRADGTLAFRDNQTIDAVNAFLGGDVFERRRVQSALVADGERAKYIAQAFDGGAGEAFLDSVLRVDNEERPVRFTYYPLENKEQCQGCHGENDLRRGVVEIALPRAELIRLQKEAQSDEQKRQQDRTTREAQLNTDTESERKTVAEKSRAYSAVFSESRDHLLTTRDSSQSTLIGIIVACAVVAALVLAVLIRPAHFPGTVREIGDRVLRFFFYVVRHRLNGFSAQR